MGLINPFAPTTGSITPAMLQSIAANSVLANNTAGPAAVTAVAMSALPAAPDLQRVLGSLRGANFNVATDQAIVIPASITKFQITSIIVGNASASLTTAAGGVYPTTAKGGVAIVAAGQLYTALTAANIILPLTLAGTVAATPYSISTVYLSLTLGQGSAATADVYVCGIDLT